MLTIEELKALPVGEWVWLIKVKNQKPLGYCTNITFTEKMCSAWGTKSHWNCLRIADYGITWLAYKNKEEAEGKSITLPYLLCTSSKFACVIWRDVDGKVHKTYTMPIEEAKRVLEEKRRRQWED